VVTITKQKTAQGRFWGGTSKTRMLQDTLGTKEKVEAIPISIANITQLPNRARVQSALSHAPGFRSVVTLFLIT
jgi:hypothetical protein